MNTKIVISAGIKFAFKLGKILKFKPSKTYLNSIQNEFVLIFLNSLCFFEDIFRESKVTFFTAILGLSR